MKILQLLVCTALLLSSCLAQASEAPNVEFKESSQGSGVEVWIGGTLFTAYRYGEGFEQKSVFYPVNAPDGTMVNRELPFDNEALRKEQDHPHHQSLFLGYGDVDGEDYWSSTHGERIVHRGLLEPSIDAPNRMGFVVEWMSAQGRVAIHEVRRVSFGGSSDSRWMDHDITLLAPGQDRVFNDTKEGLFAIRVAESLREDKGNGRYINAYGQEASNEVWGKRCPWVALRGEVDGKPVTVAFFDHPSTENYPSYWHARAYGLFSVNPFGRKDYRKGAEAVNPVLKADQAYHLRYRVVIYSGKVSKERLDEDYQAFIE